MMAGDGSGLSMPPAFVFVNPRSHRRYKKSNQDKVDGRTKGAKQMLSRITTRRKMKEQVEETIISEAVPSETERAQKQIGQMKKLNRAKDLQKKREEAIAKRLAANQPKKQKEELPKRKKPRPLVVPAQCEAEDALIMRNIVRSPSLRWY